MRMNLHIFYNVMHCNTMKDLIIGRLTIFLANGKSVSLSSHKHQVEVTELILPGPV